MGHETKLILSSLNNRRDDWVAQFTEMNNRGDDTLLDGDKLNLSAFDSDEWV